jgi:hypothetical protein
METHVNEILDAIEKLNAIKKNLTLASRQSNVRVIILQKVRESILWLYAELEDIGYIELVKKD